MATATVPSSGDNLPGVATSIASILGQVRAQLVETTPKFWTDPELTDIFTRGCVDLWGAILDLHQDHYFKIDASGKVALNAATTADISAGSKEIDGIPADCFRILLIEPLDTTVNGVGHQVLFLPRKYNHPDSIIARTLDPQDPSALPSRQIYYTITGVGAPIEPPHVITQPLLSASLPLRLVYNPMVQVDEYNPIPGGSDNALIAWTIAYAMAKEQEGAARVPDPGWLAIYGTEKQMILTRLTPRQEQEPDVVEDMFQGYGSLW